MSKPALGRGLGSLLNRGGEERTNGAPAAQNPQADSRPPAAKMPKPAGISLLLRGRDSAANGASNDAGRTTVIPPWIVPSLYASDAVMVLVTILWTAFGSGSWRWVGIALLLSVGCVQAWVAAILSAAPDRSGLFSEPETPGDDQTPAPERKAHIRVHFVDELPRNRK